MDQRDETPEEEAAANREWLGRALSLAGIAMFFGALAWARTPDGRGVVLPFMQSLPSLEFLGPVLGTAIVLTLALMALALAILIPLFILFLLVRFIRFSWDS